jgi:DNA repair photolyase
MLSKSGISSVEYAVNPYVGCQHGCVYCYARFMKRFTGHKEEWGKFVDVRVNASQVLARELSRTVKGLVMLSSVTDPYQPLEKKYELTRKCLQKLLMHQFPITILTKSSLILRDLDLLARFSNCEIGFTITTIVDDDRRKFESNSSPVEERLSALEELREKGISTYVFLGPILPYITDESENLQNMIKSFVKAKVDYVLVDRLNMRWGVWSSIVKFLEIHYPDLISKYKRIFWSENDYFEHVRFKVLGLCNDHGMKCELCY